MAPGLGAPAIRSGSRPRRAAALLATTVALAAGGLAVATPASAVISCSDVDVVFARGTFEPPGLGSVGEPFADVVVSNLPGMSVSVYAVDYPASTAPGSFREGAADLTEHVNEVAALCPDTAFVLGGMSQGAGVVGLAIGLPPPQGVPADTLPESLAPRVAAVVVFGNPLILFYQPISASPLYAPKAREFCNVGDPVCLNGFDLWAHLTYGIDGSAAEGGEFAADQVAAAP